MPKIPHVERFSYVSTAQCTMTTEKKTKYAKTDWAKCSMSNALISGYDKIVVLDSNDYIFYRFATTKNLAYVRQCVGIEWYENLDWGEFFFHSTRCCFYFNDNWCEVNEYLRAHGLDIFVGFYHLQLVASRMGILLYIGISLWIASVCLCASRDLVRVSFLAFCALRRSR